MAIAQPSLWHFERFHDPLTGWPMLGVGLTWATLPAKVTLEIAFDGVLRLTHPVTRPVSGTHLPLEPTVRQVEILLRVGDHRETIHTFPPSDVKEREPTDLGEHGPARIGPRWLSPFVTVARSATTGELFTGRWWQARIQRYSEIFAKYRRYRVILSQGSPAGRTVIGQRQAQPSASDTHTDFTRWRARPTFSILTPVYNTDPRWLTAMVESVQAQTYPHWQLVLANDASTRPETVAILNRFSTDPRIAVVHREANGHIVAASNSAAGAANGEFIALVDHDDTLEPDALAEVAALLNLRPELDLIYTDEDKLDADGMPYDPHYKPEFSPDLLLSYNYVNHLTCVRKSVFDAAGGFRVGTDGAQDLDLIFRVIALTDRVGHVPKILYHWRAATGSTASSAGLKPYVATSATQAAIDHLARLGVTNSVEPAAFALPLGLPILTLKPAKTGPSVAIVIHGEREAAAITTRAVKSLTDYDDTTIYLILDTTRRSDALNRLATARQEAILVFLEAGVEPVDADWLGRLVAHLALPGVGVVGGLVRTSAGAIVSAGTLRGDPPTHAFTDQSPNPVSYFFLAESVRTVTCPGRGVLAVRRATFDAVNGFDAERFPRTLYDLDFCLRANGLGYRSVHVGTARFFAEADQLARRDAPHERANLKIAHGPAGDQFTNPNLANDGSFRVSPVRFLVPLSRSARPPKVLFVTHHLTAVEGAPKVLRDILTGLAKRGDLVGTLTAPVASASHSNAETLNIVPHQSRFADRYIDGQWSVRDYTANQRDLVKFVHEVRPEAVVVNTLGLFPVVEACWAAGVPVVWIIHESLTPARLAATLSPFARTACETSFGLAEQVVFVSRSCRDLYARYDSRSNSTVIHNAIDLTNIDDYCTKTPRPDHMHPMRFLTVGTVCERKAQHVLIEAAALVAAVRRDFRVTLLGAREGLPYLSYCRHLAIARGVDDLVNFVIETSDVFPHYRAADVFVCTSHVEAFSLSVLEAMAFGLPILSTPCGGLAEQVTWGETGYSFPFDDARQLADLMLRLMNDPADRARLGAAGRVALELMPTPSDVLDAYAQLIHATGQSRR